MPTLQKKKLAASADATLYQRVADNIAGLVRSGTLRPGQRIPSVRRLSSQFKVSISTVLQAYSKLEDLGLVEARPQSGYYVRAQVFTAPPEPAISEPKSQPKAVSVSDLVMRVVQAARDPGIVPLGAAVSSPEFLPMGVLNRLIGQMGRRHVRLSHAYDFPPGNDLLRVQIARRMLEAGCALSPADIITTIGTQEAVNLCLRAVTKPGDTVAIESPTFYGLLQTIESQHLKALEIPTHPRTGICLESLERTVREKKVAACLLAPTFNNPLGSCMPDDAKRSLVELLARREIPLIEDDIYGELVFGPSRPVAAKSFDRTGNVLYCSSFSKTLAPGYRVGWTSPGRYTAVVERLKFINTLATPTLPQLAVAEFLATGGYDRHLRRIRRVYAEQVQRMSQSIARHFPAGTRLTRPAGGFVLWVEMPKSVDALELHNRALENKIGIAPGPIFSASQRYRNCVRLNCGLVWSDGLEKAVQTLGRLCGELV